MLQHFLRELSETPNDWVLRGVVADWCDDNNDHQRAECLRWMIAAKKRPYAGSSQRAIWFNGDRIGEDMGDPESDLPEPLFLCLDGGEEIAWHRAYTTFLEAEEALFQAWGRARAKGWVSHG